MAAAIDGGRQDDRIFKEEPGNLLWDCRSMLLFARKNSFAMPPPLLHEIAWLDSVLKALKIAPISKMTSDLIWPIDLERGAPVYVAPGDDAMEAAASPCAPPPGMSPEEVIHDIHSRLSRLISPTTSLSLQASEPSPRTIGLFGLMPPLLKWVIAIAFFSAICFVISATKIASKAANTKAAAVTASAAEASFVAASAAAASMSAAVAAPTPPSGATP